MRPPASTPTAKAQCCPSQTSVDRSIVRTAASPREAFGDRSWHHGESLSISHGLRLLKFLIGVRLHWLLHSKSSTLPRRQLVSFTVVSRYHPVSHHMQLMRKGKVRPIAWATMRKLLATSTASMQLATPPVFDFHSTRCVFCLPHIPIFLDA